LLDKNQPTRGANPAFFAVPPQLDLFVIDAEFLLMREPDM
jgi:hypothetical protein